MDEARLLQILTRLSGIRILVVGDLFLDKYLVLDGALSEISLETGLEAYQAVEKNLLPGAAGTVAKDLRALGADVSMLTVIGADGEGVEVTEALTNLGIDITYTFHASSRFTPTYFKPLLVKTNRVRELNRIDVKNHKQLPSHLEDRLIVSLREIVPHVDGVAICDQIVERNCGVITDRVREELVILGSIRPDTVFMADSRSQIGLFRNVICKPNHHEAAAAVGETPQDGVDLNDLRCWGRKLQQMTGRPLVITAAAAGIFVFPQSGDMEHIPAIRVNPPFDAVGAGDSVMSALLSALCAGASLREAAVLGSLAASVVISQIGTTGTASPEQIIEQFRKCGKELYST